MRLRERALNQVQDRSFDAVVVGGGINGAAATLALAMHGANVACITREDIAAGTSEQSSNLIWGGFKSLEIYEVPLVAHSARPETDSCVPSPLASSRRGSSPRSTTTRLTAPGGQRSARTRIGYSGVARQDVHGIAAGHGSRRPNPKWIHAGFVVVSGTATT